LEDIKEMSVAGVREFLLGAYHDLPNVLFMGSLLLGSILGYLALVWVGMGLIVNGAVVTMAQALLKLIWPTWTQVVVPSGSNACEILGRTSMVPTIAPSTTNIGVAPSHWLSAVCFFAVFVVFNSIKVAMKAPEPGVAGSKVDARRAFSLSVMVVGCVFFALCLSRGLSGCETWLGGSTGILIGSSMAIGWWYFLDACGTGKIPDVLQVMWSLAPPASTENTPVVCTPPPATTGSASCKA
jgi:hypothetical protein